MEVNLKVLSSKYRYAQLGRIRALLNEVKRKVEVKEPHKNWQYLPIFEYKFRKFGIFQPEPDQSEADTFPVVDENLISESGTNGHTNNR